MRLLVTSLAALGACQPEPPAQAPETVAFVDALPIREALMLRALRQYAALIRKTGRRSLSAYSRTRSSSALAQEARRQNIKPTPDAVERRCAATALPKAIVAGRSTGWRCALWTCRSEPNCGS